MSIFKPLTITCPSCEEAFEVDAVESVNADRRPDLRDVILDGSFQVITCPNCDTEFRLDPVFNYLDVGRGQWISVQAGHALPDWIEQEDRASEVFANAYGDKAPSTALAIGADLTPRLVFGWPALREKLLANDHGLDDTVLELTKLALIDNFGGSEMGKGAELRFEGMEGGELLFNWIVAERDESVGGMQVPRDIYDGIAADLDAWSTVIDQLSNGPFVDIQKLYWGEGREAQSEQQGALSQ